MFALEVPEFVSKDSLNFPRGAPIHQSRRDHHDRWRSSSSARLFVVVAAACCRFCRRQSQRVGIGLWIGLHVQVGNYGKIEYLAGFHQQCVELRELLG